MQEGKHNNSILSPVCPFHCLVAMVIQFDAHCLCCPIVVSFTQTRCVSASIDCSAEGGISLHDFSTQSAFSRQKQKRTRHSLSVCSWTSKHPFLWLICNRCCSGIESSMSSFGYFSVLFCLICYNCSFTLLLSTYLPPLWAGDNSFLNTFSSRQHLIYLPYFWLALFLQN